MDRRANSRYLTVSTPITPFPDPAAMRHQKASARPPATLCVDLDGTLIHSDILVESLFALLRHNLLYAFLLPIWLYQGKAYFKSKIAQYSDIDVTTLPYNTDLLTYLQQQRAAGARLVLATASNEKFAHAIAAHLGIFDQVIASDAMLNVSGRRKAALIAEKFPGKAFDYAGNSRIDLEIWRQARHAIVVNAPARVLAEARAISHVSHVIAGSRRGGRDYLAALRPHQWVKNLLLFAPMLAAHKTQELSLVGQTLVAFCAFSLCASSVYILNDLLDLEADRRHPRKCQRPFAAGTLPILHGLLMIPALLLLAFGLALLLPREFLLILAGYYLITSLYSFWLKTIVLLDVSVLAGLYTLRIIAGAAAISIDSSFWLLAFSMFLFFSLAMIKRYAELLALQVAGKQEPAGRGYDISDLEGLANFGISSGFLSVLVLALYVNSPEVRMLYQHPQLIWLPCPLLLYWISRTWLKTRRNQMHHDPIVFALRDPVSLGLGLSILLIMALAT
jgi:4-hydroxybenzoate polyprenyltransferase/phosphoserine phosphatase